jgi:Tfp pilus assembly pilus retraction ATPase PilT
MSQERTFILELKNDQTITLKFTSIEATGDRLWQTFATTEALDTVDQIISMSSNEKTSVVKNKPIDTKTAAKKQKK